MDQSSQTVKDRKAYSLNFDTECLNIVDRFRARCLSGSRKAGPRPPKMTQGQSELAFPGQGLRGLEAVAAPKRGNRLAAFARSCDIRRRVTATAPDRWRDGRKRRKYHTGNDLYDGSTDVPRSIGFARDSGGSGASLGTDSSAASATILSRPSSPPNTLFVQ